MRLGAQGRVVYVQPLSLLDFPGRPAAIAFFAGCNLRCPFCYNAELVVPELLAPFRPLPWDRILQDLRERQGFLDGVVLTGGEPLLSPHLEDFAKELKKMGFLVKLDTNGTRPEALSLLLEAGLVDYVALDLKAPFARYPEFTGFGEASGAETLVAKVRESLILVRERAPAYEFRTTVAPGLGRQDLLAIAAGIRGARRYVLQPWERPERKRLVDETWREKPSLGENELRALLPELRKFVPTELRA